MKSLEITIALTMVIYWIGVDCGDAFTQFLLEEKIWNIWKQNKTFGNFIPEQSYHLCRQSYVATHLFEPQAINYSIIALETEKRVLKFEYFEKPKNGFLEIYPFLRCRIHDFFLDYWLLSGNNSYFYCLEAGDDEDEDEDEENDENIILQVVKEYVPYVNPQV